MNKKIFCLIAITSLFVISIAEKSGADDGYFLSLYGGRVSHTPFNAIVRGILNFKDYYLVAGALGKELAVYKDKVGIEMEGQIVKHIEGKEHWEFNSVLTLRWLPFPWDKKVDTSFAWGNGFSYATDKPEFEVEDSSHNNETSQVLYYFMAEMDFALPDVSKWHVFSRIHHRSSVFGLIDGIMAGSNYVTFGVRYHFN
ncbi:hypothetical protein KAR91_74725 [Candidatus Pacearchaeota archaeon]|nr:hypothetical protein [Candidatus Pacearchaeota archaeon]